MNHPGLGDLLNCAIEAVRSAGHHALHNEHRRGEVASRSAHDVKLILDTESQKKAEEVIFGAFPKHSILGEEGSSMSEQDDYLWIVDPIDGTVNFSRGLPYWCSSVAIQVRGEIVAGAVYSPVLDELYTATSEQPAMRNDEFIHVSKIQSLDHAIALTGLAKSLQSQDHSLNIFRAVSAKVHKIRLLGAAALDICQVACGRADIFFEAGIQLWDIAAGGLIVQQAGGTSEILQTLDRYKVRYLCSNGLLHAEINDALLAAGLLSKER